ncbi:MAG: hypothetical protein ACI9Q4_002324, partial [Sediminicola sp.]
NLYGNLVAQLIKDFGLVNIFIELSEGIAPEDLKKAIHEKVYVLIMEKFADYLNLLYIIDVPENKVKAIAAIDVVEVADEVTFLILKREWQKVWFKAKYN